MEFQLYTSIVYKRVKQTKELLQDPNININANTNRGLLFHTVCLYGSREQIGMFLAHDKIEPNILNHHGETALHIVCFWEINKAIKILLHDERIDINLEDEKQISPAVFIILCNDIEIVELLLLHQNFKPEILRQKYRKNLHSNTKMGLIELAKYNKRNKTAKLLPPSRDNLYLFFYYKYIYNKICNSYYLSKWKGNKNMYFL
jgi:ankyrin repeat protein